ncbi:MAG: hypothetical protein ACWGQW_01250 [bacterium]
MPTAANKNDYKTSNRKTYTKTFCYEKVESSISHLTRTYPSKKSYRGVRHCPGNNRSKPYECWVATYPFGTDQEPDYQFLGRFDTPIEAACMYDAYVRAHPNTNTKPNFPVV